MNLDAIMARVDKAMGGKSSKSSDPLDAFNKLWRQHLGRYPAKVKVGSKWAWKDTIMDASPAGRRAIWAFEPDLTWYDFIVVNSSGGKDSMAAMLVVKDLAERQGVLDRVMVVHCDLGRVEHPGTMGVAREHARDLNLPFEVVRHDKDLIDRFEERMQTGGTWPGFGTRYCTSEFKTGRVSVLITALIQDRFGGGDLIKKMGRRARVLNVLGLRAEESRARWGPPMKVKKENQTRQVIHEWLPVQGWTTTDVWNAIRKSGLRPHPYYTQDGGGRSPEALGRRLSCRFCPLAADEDLQVAGRLYPEFAKVYLDLEKKYNKPFKERRYLRDILGVKGSKQQSFWPW